MPEITEEEREMLVKLEFKNIAEQRFNQEMRKRLCGPEQLRGSDWQNEAIACCCCCCGHC
jgi:hypothetical protein